jgi:Ca2+-binding EF-hand superfamily protein
MLFRKSEFVVYKLKEMGKISEKDIMMICNQFQRLDTGNCGKITLSDLLESLTWSQIPGTRERGRNHNRCLRMQKLVDQYKQFWGKEDAQISKAGLGRLSHTPNARG